MSLPINTLWYNGDWDLFVGIHDVDGFCPCGVSGDSQVSSESCVSRPPNEFNQPDLLMGTYTDFDVTAGTGWKITGAFSDNFTFMDELDVLSLSVMYEIRKDVTPYDGGTVVATGIASGLDLTIEPTGRSTVVDLITYTEYRFLVNNLDINLSVGKYWVNVAPIITPALITTYDSNYLLFNSTTIGTNSIGVPAGNNANDFFAVGLPDPVNNFIPTTEFGSEFHDFSNGVTGFILPVCIDPDMLAELFDGSLKRVGDLEVGDLLKTENPLCPAKVVINHKNQLPHRVLVKIDQDAISKGVPNKTLYITTNHKVVINGNLVKPRDLLNGGSVSRSRKKGPIRTNTIVTDNGQPVFIQNLLVATWKFSTWQTKNF